MLTISGFTSFVCMLNSIILLRNAFMKCVRQVTSVTNFFSVIYSLLQIWLLSRHGNRYSYRNFILEKKKPFFIWNVWTLIKIVPLCWKHGTVETHTYMRGSPQKNNQQHVHCWKYNIYIPEYSKYKHRPHPPGLNKFSLFTFCILSKIFLCTTWVYSHQIWREFNERSVFGWYILGRKLRFLNTHRNIFGWIRELGIFLAMCSFLGWKLIWNSIKSYLVLKRTFGGFSMHNLVALT